MPDARLDKLEALLARAVPDAKEPASVLAPLLGLDGSTRYPTLSLTPRQHKARIFAAVMAQLTGLARHQPLLMIAEDIHWFDPTTMELFSVVVEALQRLPALLVATLRPELQPPWTALPSVTLLTLERLCRAHAAALIDGVTGGRVLPVPVAEAILARTEGIPLFVEELTSAVLESRLLREHGGAFELAGPLPPLAIPSTLQDSLMARLTGWRPPRSWHRSGRRSVASSPTSC